MKQYPVAFLLALFLIPAIAAEIPPEIEQYCSGFDAAACGTNASWFMLDSCKSKIRCVSDVDETLAFTGCRTVLQYEFDDCENQPSTLCYNKVAYDTSTSQTCGNGGAQFKKVDSCGNPTEDGPCIKLSTCEEKIESPHTGTSITTHVNCEIDDGTGEVTSREERQNDQDDDRDDNNDNGEESFWTREDKNPELDNQETTQPMLNRERTASNTQTTSPIDEGGITIRAVTSRTSPLIIGALIIIVLLIAGIVYTAYRLLKK